MSKHTPGPWLPSKFGFQVLTGDSWNTICTLRGGAEWGDGRGKYEQEYEWQNQEANARLIAAAPDMLDALREIEEWADDRADVDDGQPNDAMWVLVIVRAAIKRAIE
jgi:hypothetical protein